MDYNTEVKQYKSVLERYQRLTDVDHAQAFQLKKQSLILAERFSEILYEVRKENKAGKKDAELRDRAEHIYKLLKEIHVDCRMIWARGKEERV